MNDQPGEKLMVVVVPCRAPLSGIFVAVLQCSSDQKGDASSFHSTSQPQPAGCCLDSAELRMVHSIIFESRAGAVTTE